MGIIEAKIADCQKVNNRQVDSQKLDQSHKQLRDSLLPAFATVLRTITGTMTGTAIIVGIHHNYRKKKQPEARLQDYATGVFLRLHSSSVTNNQLARLRFACQQATFAWRQAYRSPADFEHTKIQNHEADIESKHTTTMRPRPVCWVSGVAAMLKDMTTINDGASSDDDFGVVGIDADRQIIWQTTMPERVHDIVVQPIVYARNKFDHNNKNRHVVVMGRRPSEKFWVLDAETGKVKFAIKASAYRHFYGHACYSLDGSKLFVTENDTLTLDGKIGIYDAHSGYQKVAEFDSHGIGPHELVMHPDGDTLVIANGGIKTEQASREELNLDSMRPSLVYLNRHDGQLLEQITPEHNQMSVRHLAIHDDGTVMIGIQFQGEKHINVPLVLTHSRGDSSFKALSMPNDKWQRFHQYIASVAVDSKRNLLCVTTPIGGCAAVFDLNSRTLIDDVSLPDCAGASVAFNSTHKMVIKADSHKVSSSFIVSDGQGQLTALYMDDLAITETDTTNKSNRLIQDSELHMMSFDNHLQAL